MEEINEFIENAKAEAARLKEMCDTLEKITSSVISEIWGQAKKSSELAYEIVRLRQPVDELRPSADMTRPQPCTMPRITWTAEWLEKLSEETNEVTKGAIGLLGLEECREHREHVDSSEMKKAKDDLAVKLTNVKVLCESWLYGMGYDEEARGELCRRVNEKNKFRR